MTENGCAPHSLAGPWRIGTKTLVLVNPYSRHPLYSLAILLLNQICCPQIGEQYR